MAAMGLHKDNRVSGVRNSFNRPCMYVQNIFVKSIIQWTLHVNQLSLYSTSSCINRLKPLKFWKDQSSPWPIEVAQKNKDGWPSLWRRSCTGTRATKTNVQVLRNHVVMLLIYIRGNEFACGLSKTPLFINSIKISIFVWAKVASCLVEYTLFGRYWLCLICGSSLGIGWSIISNLYSETLHN